jgi:hypothetical protein
VKDRRVLPSGEIEEWEREKTIPDDFVYDPETDSYYAPFPPDEDEPEEDSPEELPPPIDDRTKSRAPGSTQLLLFGDDD